MKFLTNLDDPKNPNHFLMVACMYDQIPASALKAEQQWLRDKIIGLPQATKHYSQEQLIQMGMVGIYSNDEI